jgi:hypothetical protein
LEGEPEEPAVVRKSHVEALQGDYCQTAGPNNGSGHRRCSGMIYWNKAGSVQVLQHLTSLESVGVEPRINPDVLSSMT